MKLHWLGAGLVAAMAGGTALAQQTEKPLAPATVEGKSVETRQLEKKDDAPLFPNQTRAPYHKTADFKVTTLLDNQHVVWGMAFLPDGRMLLNERLPGAMHILDKAGKMSTPLQGVYSVAADGKNMVLLDVAVDPKFTQNHRIFFTFCDYFAPAPGAKMTDSNTFVASARLDGDAVTGAKVIFRAAPNHPANRLGGKTGGRIAFGPDGNLFVTIGDRDDSPKQVEPDWFGAQKLDSDLGKVIHITPDGAPVPGNPFISKAGSVARKSGPTAAAVRKAWPSIPPPAHLWETELGPRGGDEINIIKKGANYGWPVIVHGIDYPGVPIGDGITQKEGMEQPTYYWDPSEDPAGMAFYRGNLFPAVEEQPVHRPDERQDFSTGLSYAGQQGGVGRGPAGGHGHALPRRQGGTGWRGLCDDRQRHGLNRPRYAGD